MPDLPPVAAAVIVERGRVLLIRHRHPEGDLVWQLPAGKLGDGETAAQAAERETAEETGLSAPERVFAYREARGGSGGVLQVLGDAQWVNDPIAAARCEYKPVQLAAATEVGLAVPATLVTSDPQAAHRWAKDLGRPIIYRPLGGIWHGDQGRVRVLYTTPVEDVNTLLDPALARTAHLFQERIDAVCAARAVVVGDRVFAMGISSWRPTRPGNGAGSCRRSARRSPPRSPTSSPGRSDDRLVGAQPRHGRAVACGRFGHERGGRGGDAGGAAAPVRSGDRLVQPRPTGGSWTAD